MYDNIIPNSNHSHPEVVVVVRNPNQTQEIKKLEETINFLSVCLAMQQFNQPTKDTESIDSLTGLYWRTEERREEETNGKAYAVIDMRKLHEQNRKYGHEIVDEQGFRPFGKYMKENFRQKDRVTRTIGQSDEFQVVAYGCTVEELENKLAGMQRYYKNNKMGVVLWDYAVGESIAEADINLINVKAKRNPLKYAWLKTTEGINNMRVRLKRYQNPEQLAYVKI